MGVINRKGCTCAACRSPEVVARLALDEADEPDRLVRALRRKYRTPADALAALGLDESVLYGEGERTMPKPSYDARNRDMRRGDQEMMMPEYDRRNRDMRTRDWEDPEVDPNREGGESEPSAEELMAMLRDMSAQDRRMVADWMRGRMPTYDRRMMGRDDPPPFMGMPETGGTMYGSTNWSDERQARDYRKRREAEDGRRRRFAHDMAMRDDSFYRMFPDARRLGVTGF